MSPKGVLQLSDCHSTTEGQTPTQESAIKTHQEDKNPVMKVINVFVRLRFQRQDAYEMVF